jgi:hypothetical protein
MTTFAYTLLLLFLVPQSTDKVESSFDKKADFSAFRTYAWNKGHEAFNPAAHQAIVEAIDTEMAALGYMKGDARTTDVVLKYHVVRGSDVDLEVLEKAQRAGRTEPVREGILGKLVVVLYRTGSTSTPLWQAQTRRHLSDDAATATREIQQAVASLFETYPGRKK